MSEQTVWTGTPSQITNFWIFLAMGIVAVVIVALAMMVIVELVFIVVPLAVILWRWLVVKNTQYELTTERLKTREGVLNRKIDELELYRVKDYSMEQPLFLRLFGKSNIMLETSDKSHPTLMLYAVADGETLRNMIRSQVEACRIKKGVRETDFAS